MKTPRNVTGDEAVRALRRLGFAEVRQTGSHRILRQGDRTVVVPQHRPIKPGTLRGLVEQAGITMETLRRPPLSGLSVQLASGNWQPFDAIAELG